VPDEVDGDDDPSEEEGEDAAFWLRESGFLPGAWCRTYLIVRRSRLCSMRPRYPSARPI